MDVQFSTHNRGKDVKQFFCSCLHFGFLLAMALQATDLPQIQTSKNLCSVINQVDHKEKRLQTVSQKAWSAALTLPGALPDNRKVRERWERLWETRFCSLIWQHILLSAGSLASRKINVMDEKGEGGGRGRAGKGRERGCGLILNMWSVYKPISTFIVSEKCNSIP